MRTLGTLVCGWLLGAAVMVVLAAPLRERARGTAPVVPSAKLAVSAVQAATAFQLLMPVLGIEPRELQDTYTQARSGGRTHNAIDIRAPRGTAVLAAVDGTIRKLFTSRAGGLTIYEFDQKAERCYYYAHLDHYAAGIYEGLFVKAGTVIGYVGTTGNAPPDTPHLHFAVEVLPPTKEWWKGVPVNPYPLLTERVSALR